MATPFRQESFAGGILGSRTKGRNQLARYAVSVAELRNFLPVPEGAAFNRAGFPYVTEAKDSAAGIDRPIRLIPFVFSESPGQAYVLELGEGYARFVVDGAHIADPVNPAVPYEIATPYSAADLARLKYAQQGDVVTLTRQGYDVRELKRYAHQDWRLEVLSFDVPVPNGDVYVHPDSIHGADGTHLAKDWRWRITEIWEDESGLQWETSPLEPRYIAVLDRDPWSGTFVYPKGAIVTAAGNIYRSLDAGNIGNDPSGTGAAYWLLDETAYNQAITYPAGAVVFSSGQRWRSLQDNNLNYSPETEVAWWVAEPVAPAPQLRTNPLPATFVVYPDRTAKLWARGGWGITVPGSRLVGRRVFRGRGSFFGWVGEFTDATFLDDGATPDLSSAPPQGRNPFKILKPDGTLLRTEQPALVAFHDQRRTFLGTVQRPATALLSRVGDFYNFDRHVPANADDGFELELAGRLREEARWAVAVDQLVIGTQSSIWALGAPTGSVLAPNSWKLKVQGSAGSSYLDPILVPPDVILYVRAKGQGVRDLVFDDGRRKFVGSDLSLLVKHLFRGHTIVDWAYQEDPYSVAWLVRDDGKLLSLTYVRDQEVWAWAWHDTSGLVENVAVIPEGTEDRLYLGVKRQRGDGSWHRYIERMATREIPLDALGQPDPKECIFLDSARTARAVASVDNVATIGNLGHLEGLQVVALADGAVHRNAPGDAGELLIVQGGQVQLPDAEGEGFDVVHVGLPYVSELELLPLVVQGRDLRSNLKNVGRVAFELEASGGEIEVAERLADRRGVATPDADWTPWEDQREVEDGYGPLPLYSGELVLSVFSTWNRAGTAALRQRDPLPCGILAVTREAEIGGS
jgi:hypothetical protein